MTTPEARPVPAAGRWPQHGLRSGQIAIRVWQDEDAEQLLALLSDPLTRRWSPLSTEPSEADSAARIGRAREQAERGTPSSFAVVDAERPELVLGSFDWRTDHPPSFSVLDVGYAVAPSARRLGVGSSALRLATEWLLDPDGGDVVRVQLDHAIRNEASCRTAVRAGFAIEGRRDSFLPLQATPDAPVERHDVCLHGRVRNRRQHHR